MSYFRIFLTMLLNMYDQYNLGLVTLENVKAI